MTYENTPGDGEDQGQESGVLKAVRAELRAAVAELKTRPDEDTLRAEFKAEQAKNTAVIKQLVAYGQPEGLSETIASKVEGDVTEESVLAALKSIGLDAVETEGGVEEADPNAALAEVSGLSGEVSAAANANPAVTGLQSIAEAETVDDLQAIADEGGWGTNYT